MELTKEEEEVFDLIDRTYNNHWHSTSDLIKQELAKDIVKLFTIPDVRLSLPRPIEAYNKARQLSNIAEYCDWFLEQEKRGNEV